MTTGAPTASIEQAFDRLGLAEPPAPDFEGLRKLYRAWCLRVPFDNIRKTIALRTDAPGPLPGITPEDFLDSWAEHGTGGTCWPINNALHTLFKAAGFDAIRITGSMWDLGIDNHGSIIVRIDGKDWLADAALQTKEPLPLVPGLVHIAPDPIYKAEIDPEGDGFFLWALHPPLSHLLPCHLMDRDVSEDLFSANYERSREISPFNAKLYARRNFEDHVRVLSGNVLFEVTASGQKVTELSGEQLLSELTGPFGYSDEVVERWVQCGALQASVAPSEPPPKPPLTRTPPSLRTGSDHH